jgi:hypothetical protein
VIFCKLQIALTQRSFTRVWAVPADFVGLLDAVVVQHRPRPRTTVVDELPDTHIAVLSARTLLAKLVLSTFFVEAIYTGSSSHVGERTVAVDHAVAPVVPVFCRVEALFLRVEFHQLQQLTVSKQTWHQLLELLYFTKNNNTRGLEFDSWSESAFPQFFENLISLKFTV